MTQEQAERDRASMEETGMTEREGWAVCRMLYAFYIGDEEQTRIDDPEIVKLVKNSKKRKAVQALINAEEYNLAIILFVRSIVGLAAEWKDTAPHARRFAIKWEVAGRWFDVVQDIKRTFQLAVHTF